MTNLVKDGPGDMNESYVDQNLLFLRGFAWIGSVQWRENMKIRERNAKRPKRVSINTRGMKDWSVILKSEGCGVESSLGMKTRMRVMMRVRRTIPNAAPLRLSALEKTAQSKMAADQRMARMKRPVPMPNISAIVATCMLRASRNHLGHMNA